ncbi:MAG: HEPN domain-containing protein, partial [Armatimonadota bacterium]|nr:HEPN domain-containing protein [Armatimonadota bacterium]MDW8144085.1 HEPN domain-containing protein [Armatimonadota bacterium]
SIVFSKTHNLVELLNLSGGLLPELDPLRPQLQKLSDYAVITRYRGFWATQQDADEAMQTAGQVRAVVRSKLGLP